MSQTLLKESEPYFGGMRTTAIVDHSSSFTFIINVPISSAFYRIIHLGLYKSQIIFFLNIQERMHNILTNTLLTMTLVMPPEIQILQFESHGLKTWKHEEEMIFQTHILPDMWVSSNSSPQDLQGAQNYLPWEFAPLNPFKGQFPITSPKWNFHHTSEAESERWNNSRLIPDWEQTSWAWVPLPMYYTLTFP